MEFTNVILRKIVDFQQLAIQNRGFSQILDFLLPEVYTLDSFLQQEGAWDAPG
jgi:hypothetical protein